jgi:hypothetical protein
MISSDGTQSAAVAQTTVYLDMTESTTFKVKAGESVTPTLTFAGSWMHSYFYLDRGNDGAFSYDYDASTGFPTATSDMLAYSFYSASDASTDFNSLGQKVANGASTYTIPTCTIPAELAPGFYRARYKTDWNSIDPGGNSNSGNLIYNNGGRIIDVLINVHEDQVSVSSASAANGTVAAGTDGKAPFNAALTITVTPDAGYECTGLTIRHGYNLDGEQYVHSNRQWQEITVDASSISNNSYTLAATNVDGNILVTPTFAQITGIDNIAIDNAPAVYYNLNGIEVSADDLTPGIYLCRQGSKVTKVVIR